MYSFSKIGLLILWPIVTFLLPLVLLSSLVFGLVSDRTGVATDLSIATSVNLLATLLLCILAGIYLYQIHKKMLFKVQPNGSRLAKVSDYFAIIFAFFVLAKSVSYILPLLLII